MNFRDALLSIYCENPCQVLPNALWKTITQIEDLQTTFKIEEDAITYMKIWNEKSLLGYWTRNRETSPDFLQQKTDLDLVLIHQDYLHSFAYERFAIQKQYFKLIYKQNGSTTRTTLPNGFSIIDVNIKKETQMAADLIERCYQEIQPTAEMITSWSEHPVFEPTLWIWVFDDTKGIPIGLGIAEIDHDILEGSLEWIQVLPEYQGRGIGKCIVQELLSRLEKWTKFTTVAGEVENTTNPEALYRNCGFTGSDIWWMFRTG